MVLFKTTDTESIYTNGCNSFMQCASNKLLQLTSALTRLRKLIDKKKRYLGFISKPKTRNKFLRSIYHDLESCLDSTKQVDSFSTTVQLLPGFKFEPENIYGQPISSLGEICTSFDESFLVVSNDGKFAIHGPETHIDSRAFYAV